MTDSRILHHPKLGGSNGPHSEDRFQKLISWVCAIYSEAILVFLDTPISREQSTQSFDRSARSVLTPR